MKKLKYTHSRFSISLSLSSNVIVKTHKPQLCYYPDGLMVKLSVFQAVTTACAGSNPARGNFFPPKTFFHF